MTLISSQHVHISFQNSRNVEFSNTWTFLSKKKKTEITNLK
jgi:hypothetical protein